MEKKIQICIYEGPMCCSSGVCGPSPDQKMIALQDTILKIEREYPDVKVNRYTMNYQPQEFMKNLEVFQKVKEHKTELLPITTINGVIVSERDYLNYEELINEITKVEEE